jgi:hypothetical protein
LSKKIKDLTLGQIYDICTCYYPACCKNGVKCPLFDKTIGCDDIIATIRSALKHNPDALEEEVEIRSEEDDK